MKKESDEEENIIKKSTNLLKFDIFSNLPEVSEKEIAHSRRFTNM